MVESVKIFKFKDPMDLEKISEMLDEYKMENPVEDEDFSLKTNFEKIGIGQGRLTAIFTEDSLIQTMHRGEEVNIPETEEHPIAIYPIEGETYLAVFASKHKANRIANEMSKILYMAQGKIIEGEIPEDELKQLHESNPESTRAINFGNIDMPNVGSLSLFGNSLTDSEQYRENLEHGDISYVVFEIQKRGITVGMSGDASVVIFSKMEPEKIMEFIQEDIIPLVK